MSIEATGGGSCGYVDCGGPSWGGDDSDTLQVDTATKAHIVLISFLRSNTLRFDKNSERGALLHKSIGPFTWLEHIWDAEYDPPQMPDHHPLPPGMA